MLLMIDEIMFCVLIACGQLFTTDRPLNRLSRRDSGVELAVLVPADTVSALVTILGVPAVSILP